MPQASRHWTAKLVRELPDDGKRYEVVDGELLVTPSPGKRHQRAVRLLLVALDRFVTDHGIGEVWLSPSDIELDPASLVQPDLYVCRGFAKRWNDPDAPLILAVEVLSPSSTRADRTIKRRRYQRAGIPEYWVVDIDGRCVDIWHPGDAEPRTVRDLLRWPAPGVLQEFELDLRPFFQFIREIQS